MTIATCSLQTPIHIYVGTSYGWLKAQKQVKRPDGITTVSFLDSYGGHLHKELRAATTTTFKPADQP